jgi:SAM-dependent methyltransferase
MAGCHASRHAADRAADTPPAGILPSPLPRVDDSWDGVGAAWSSARPQRLWRDFTDQHQLTLVRRWLDRGGEGGAGPHDPGAAATTVLKTDLFDEVAGRGLVAALTAAGLRVTAVDVSPGIVAEATSRNPGLEAIAADVRTLPFPEGAFDAVFSGSTLDHFESTADIEAALVELQRVLRPGGRMVLTLDNPANPLIWLRNGPLLALLRRIGVVPYQVGVTLGPRALTAAVRRAGFDVVEATAVMHCPRVLAVAMARLVEGLPQACRDAFFRSLAACEWLERLPTRWLTGHYTAICADVTAPHRADERP